MIQQRTGTRSADCSVKMEANVQNMSDGRPKSAVAKPAQVVEEDTSMKSSLIKDGLQKNISEDSKNKIYNILSEVNRLSDVEKLLLYLELPSGVSTAPLNSGSEPSYQREEHQKALRWLRTHLEEDTGTCVQKSELYAQYRDYCDKHHYKCVNQFDFGKLLRHLFPNLKLRHLGQRGQSKTCYGGLKSCNTLKPLTIPKFDIAEDLNKNVPGGAVYGSTPSLEEDITTAACQLVCEWASKLHAKQPFSTVQELAEDLITNCVVSTSSKAAFTIIAAAQREDRKILTDNQPPPPLPSSKPSESPASSTKSMLQAKTQLQLQRTLKGRKMLREQREIIGSLGNKKPEAKPSDNIPEVIQKEIPPQPAEVKIQKKVLTPQKHILPKRTQAQMAPSAGTAVVAGTKSTVVVPGTRASLTTSSYSVPQPLFVLPPQVVSATPQTKGGPPALQSQPMLILSPVNNNDKCALTADKLTSNALLSGSQKFVSSKPVCRSNGAVSQSSTTTKPSSTARANSRLAMLLTERKTDNNERRLLEKALRHKDARLAKTEDKVEAEFPLKHLSTLEQQRSHPASTVALESRSPAVLAPSSVISHSAPHSPAVLPSSQQVTLLPLQASTVNRLLIPVKDNAPQTPPVTAKEMKVKGGKKKATPVKPRPSSKTVSTLLKETRGYGPQTECKGFVNDRRPVAELLKESRRKCSTDSPPSTPQPISRKQLLRSLSHQENIVKGGAGSPASVLLRRASLSALEATMQSRNLVNTASSPHTGPNSPVVYSTDQPGFFTQDSGPTTMVPSHTNQDHTDFRQGDPLSGKDPFTCFGKEPVIPGSEVAMCFSAQNSLSNSSQGDFQDINQDSNNNDGCQNKIEPLYSSDDSNELVIQISPDEMEPAIDTKKEEVSIHVSNLEKDALGDYLSAELSSDLADITPSLTIDGGSTGSNTAPREFPTFSEDANISTSNLIKRALVAENRNPFMSPPDVQQRLAMANIQNSGLSQNMLQRPASEMLQQDPCLVGTQSSAGTILRPSTMPPELDNNLAASGADLQNFLMQTQPTVAINDNANSSNSQMVYARSPSFCSTMGSGPSTPSSMMSPPERFQTNIGIAEPSNSFMPIHGSMGSLPLDQVSPIRPMVTLARKQANGIPVNHGQTVAMSNNANQMGQFPRFANPAASSNNNYSSFVPYNMNDTTTQSNFQQQQQQQVQQQQAQQQQLLRLQAQNQFLPQVSQSLQQHPSPAQPDHNFLPASSIRPVKRPMAGAQNGSRKRVRHRSAQDAQSLAKAQAKNAQAQAKKATPYNMLTALLKAGYDARQLHSLLSNKVAQNQQAAVNGPRPCTLPESLDHGGKNMSNPQSPFSPEMHDIMANDPQPSTMEAQDQPDLGIFRSHSVPAQSLQRAGSEDPGVGGERVPGEDYGRQDDPDISHLLQDKLQNQPARVGIHDNAEFSARRNINNLLQEEGGAQQRKCWFGQETTSQNAQYRSSVRGDHMISGASVRTSQHLELLRNPVIQQALRLYRQNPAPTPPSSQNPTPDLELSAMTDQTAGFSVGHRGLASSVMDTPNSLDTLTSVDGQDPANNTAGLKDVDILGDIYKDGTDLGQNQVWTVQDNCQTWNRS